MSERLFFAQSFGPSFLSLQFFKVLTNDQQEKYPDKSDADIVCREP